MAKRRQIEEGKREREKGHERGGENGEREKKKAQ